MSKTNFDTIIKSKNASELAYIISYMINHESLKSQEEIEEWLNIPLQIFSQYSGTDYEIISQQINLGYKWVARDQDKVAHFYHLKPVRDKSAGKFKLRSGDTCCSGTTCKNGLKYLTYEDNPVDIIEVKKQLEEVYLKCC